MDSIRGLKFAKHQTRALFPISTGLDDEMTESSENNLLVFGKISAQLSRLNVIVTNGYNLWSPMPYAWIDDTAWSSLCFSIFAYQRFASERDWLSFTS